MKQKMTGAVRAGAAVLIMAVLTGMYAAGCGMPAEKKTEILLAEPEEESPSSEGQSEDGQNAADAAVHVCGAVERAGVYRLPLGSRVIDAVECAGGMTADADPDRLNLAEYVKDGEFCDFIHLVPTKVLASTINYEKSYESGFLLMESGEKTFPVITNLKQVDYNYKGTDTKHYAINNYQEAMEDPKYGLTIVPFFEVQIEGTSETQKTSPYNDFKANRNLSNVYDFIVRDGNVYSFRSDLFTIRIKGLENTVINATQINTSNGLKFNSSTKTLTYKLTISAVEYIGFPTIQLIMNDLRNEDDESLPIKYYLFDLNGYIPGDGEPSNDDQTLNIIRGFHNMMRFDTEDPSSGVGNLDVNLSLYYIYTSKPVEVQIDYTNLYIGHEDVYKQGISVGSVILTGKNKNEYTEGLLTTVSLDKSGYLRKRLTKNDKVYLLNSMGYDVDKGNLAMYEKYLSYDDILKYNVYVIKQARYILDILETIAANTTQGSDDNVTANTYIGYIYSFGKGDTKYYASDTKYVFPRFSSDGYSSGSLIQFINRFKHIHGETISLSLGSDGLLEFAEINILELFKSNVNYNYYNNAFSYGDMIVSTVTLNQLYQYQNNHGNSKNWCYNIAIGEKAPYTADQGYMYLDWAKLSYGADISNGTLTTSCETPPNSESGEEDQSDAVVPISSDKDRHNRIAGIFNGYERYAGSFMARFSSAMLAASDEFNGDDLNIKSILKIDKAKDKRLKTAASEWNPEPMKNKVISFGVAILDIVVTVVSSVYSGGTGALAWGALKKTLLKAMAKAAIKATVTDFVLDCVDGYIRSMYLDGKDIFNEIGKMLKA